MKKAAWWCMETCYPLAVRGGTMLCYVCAPKWTVTYGLRLEGGFILLLYVILNRSCNLLSDHNQWPLRVEWVVWCGVCVCVGGLLWTCFIILQMQWIYKTKLTGCSSYSITSITESIIQESGKASRSCEASSRHHNFTTFPIRHEAT